MQYTDIWVSAGTLDTPYYRFFADPAGSHELPELVFSTNHQYTFRRLNEATSHPFYIRPQGFDLSSSQFIVFSGDGTSARGIIGSEEFSLLIPDSIPIGSTFEYYCTSHPLMRRSIVFEQEFLNLYPAADVGLIRLEVSRLYTAAFGRLPDDVGLNFWMDVLSDPLVGLKDISRDFVDSSEFSAIAPPDSSSAVFTTALYQNVLGRDPEPLGLVHWTNQLDSGVLDRSDVLIGFANSPENIALYELLV